MGIRRLLPAGENQGPALAVPLLDEPPLLEPLEVEVDRGGGLEAHRLADLPHRGGIALPGDHLPEIGVDPVRHLGFLRHGAPPVCSGPRGGPLSVAYFSHLNTGREEMQHLFSYFPLCPGRTKKFRRIPSCIPHRLMVS